MLDNPAQSITKKVFLIVFSGEETGFELNKWYRTRAVIFCKKHRDQGDERKF